MSMVLISTGALIGRPHNRDFYLLKDFAKQLKCDGFEFMMYNSWYQKTDELLSFLVNSKLMFPVMHAEKSIGEAISKGGDENFEDAFNRFRVNCQIAKEIGAGKMVVHLWDGITSDQNFQNNIDAYPVLLDMANSEGVDLLCENVVCNCNTPFDNWKTLYKKYPDIHFIWDTKMAAFHGQDEYLYREENSWLMTERHIRHFHVNDYAGGIMDWASLKTLAIGRGHVDFEKFFDFIMKTEYKETFTLESTAFDQDANMDFAMLNDEVDFIKSRI